MSESGSIRRHVVTVVICSAIAFGWLGFILIKSGIVTQITGSGYQVNVMMPTASSLTDGDRVTMAGVAVGEVTGVQRDNFDARVSLTLIDKRVYPLPVDSRVSIRQHTPVGENYVSITRGSSSRMLPSGGVLPLSQSNQYVDVDQVLSVLQGPTRDRARQIFQSLGTALNGRGAELNSVVGQASGVIGNISALTGQVLAPERRQIADLVSSLGDVASAIGERSQAIRTIADRGLVALGALRTRDQALAATLRALPGTLSNLHALAGTLGSVSAQATPVLTNLAGAVDALRPAVLALPAAGREGRQVLSSLSSASPGLQRTLRQVSSASRPVSGVLPTVSSTLCQLNPMLRYVNGRAYDALAVLIGLGSASNSYDATGHLIRLFPIIGDASASGLPAGVEKADLTLLHSGLVGNSTALSFDPYPVPSALGTDHATNGGPVGPSEVTAKTGYRYPHITADC
jgi:phospholipid/cholesterol/gamma-HCH transport system substrate-binding protein